MVTAELARALHDGPGIVVVGGAFGEMGVVERAAGALAHCDMPVETGPTMYLPHSRKYLPGYLAWHEPEFRAYFGDQNVLGGMD